MRQIFEGFGRAIVLLFSLDTQVWSAAWVSLRVSLIAVLMAAIVGVPVATALAQRFHEPESVGQLFETLASQENEHAELLEVCRAAVAPGKWAGKELAGWLDSVGRLEAQMNQIEAQLDGLGSVHNALRIVIEIESSEVNQVYLAILGASDSQFVRRLNVFRDAGMEHIDYACRAIPELAPDLAEDCRRLRAEYARTVRGRR